MTEGELEAFNFFSLLMSPVVYSITIQHSQKRHTWLNEKGNRRKILLQRLYIDCQAGQYGIVKFHTSRDGDLARFNLAINDCGHPGKWEGLDRPVVNRKGQQVGRDYTRKSCDPVQL